MLIFGSLKELPVKRKTHSVTDPELGGLDPRGGKEPTDHTEHRETYPQRGRRHHLYDLPLCFAWNGRLTCHIKEIRQILKRRIAKETESGDGHGKGACPSL